MCRRRCKYILLKTLTIPYWVTPHFSCHMSISLIFFCSFLPSFPHVFYTFLPSFSSASVYPHKDPTSFSSSSSFISFVSHLLPSFLFWLHRSLIPHSSTNASSASSSSSYFPTWLVTETRALSRHTGTQD